MTNSEDTLIDDPGAPPEARVAAIQDWVQDISNRIVEIREEILPLQSELASLREERRILLEFLKVRDSEISLSPTNTISQNPTPTHAGRETVRERVQRGVIQVLSMSAGPMNIKDILEEYKRQGFKVPGKGRPSNITAHLPGCDEIINTSRGFYALADNNSKDGEL